MKRSAVSARSVIVLTLALFSVGCAPSAGSRWDRPSSSEIEALADLDVLDHGEIDGVETVEIDVGPVVEVAPIRTVLRGADVVIVDADLAGRVQRSLPSPGDPIESGDPIVELGAQPDDGEQIRLQILDLERALAELELRDADVERLDAEISELRVEIAGDGGEILAPVGGIFSHHLVALFGTVDVGEPVAAIARSSDAVAEVNAGATADGLVVDDVVTIEARSADFDESFDAPITAIDGSIVTVAVPPESGLAIGDRAVVTLAVPTADVLRVDTRAVRSADGGDFVVAVDASGEWEQVAVTVDTIGGGVVAISDATGRLQPGTVVVLP